MKHCGIAWVVVVRSSRCRSDDCCAAKPLPELVGREMGAGGPSCRRQERRASLSADRREDGFDRRDEEDIATEEVRAFVKRADRRAPATPA
jgi:hypothetical protein